MPEITLEQVKEAIEKQGKTWHEEQKVVATRVAELEKSGKVASETLEKLAKMEADMVEFGSIKASFVAMERALKRLPQTIENKGKELPEDHEEVKASYQGFLRKGKDADGQEWRFKAKGDGTKATSMSIISDPDGGYMVPTDTNGRTVQRVFETSPLRAYAAVQQISGPELTGMYDDNEATVGWVAETGARAQQSNPQVGRWTVAVHEEYALVQISQQLLDDASFDPEAWMVRKIADKFARNENVAFVNGNAATQPQGFLTLPSGTALRTQIQQIGSGSSGALTYAGLVKLLYGLKSDYRQRSTFGGTRGTYSAIRQLTDSLGRPLWEMSMQAASPDRLLGRPVAEFNDMPDPGAGTLSLALADWQEAYQIVDRIGIRTLRDPYTAKPFVVLYSTKRTGGRVINTEAIKLQVLT